MTTRSLMVAVAVRAVVPTLPGITWLTSTAIGDGFVDVPLVFLVVDESTGYLPVCESMEPPIQLRSW
jgi:hypothetical protein